MSQQSPEPVNVVVVGAGDRGTTYAQFALDDPKAMRVTAVVDPDADRRARLADEHALALDMRFETVAEFAAAAVAGSVSVGAAINATPDRKHLDVTRGLLELGADVMSEKPVATSRAELAELAALTTAHPDRVTRVCHVLRYAPFYEAVQAIVDSGELGEPITIAHQENLAFWHFAHSFVRGNWRSAAASAPLILAKCCHDIDLLLQWVGEPFTHVVSTGSLRHFVAENAPAGATNRCSDPCPAAPGCSYDARQVYGTDGDHWPVRVVTPIPTRQARLEALETSPYGRCVYACDNDVVDHQTAVFESASGVVTTLTISGHAHAESRRTTIDGTKGSLTADFTSEQTPRIVIHNHRERRSREIDLGDPAQDRRGHGGGDRRMVADFVRAVRARDTASGATIASALPSHFAALAPRPRV